jgi:alkylation response protein AidB-like acyl-CoA dehydrogenase
MNAASGLDTETRTLLDDSIVRFAGGGTAEPSWQALAGNGWLGLALPEQHGGYGAAIGDLLTLLRISGAHGWRLPLIQCLGEACGALLAAPPGAERDRLLTRVAAGESVIGLCAIEDEPAFGSADGESHRLEGTCHFLIGGDLWDHVLIEARLSGSADTGLFAIDGRAPQLRRHRMAAIDQSEAIDLELNGVPATLLGPAEPACAAGRRRALILAAAESLGLAQAAFDATCAHLAERRQFGQPIIRFQAIRHRLVELHIMERELSAMLDAACLAYDEGRPGLDKKLWRLRAQSARTALSITGQAIQLHGGMGMTCELPVGRYYKRALLLDGLFGSCRDAIGALAAALPVPDQGPRE